MIKESKLPFIESLVSLGCYEGEKGAALYDMSIQELTNLLEKQAASLLVNNSTNSANCSFVLFFHR